VTGVKHIVKDGSDSPVWTWLWLVTPFTTFIAVWLITGNLYGASGGFVGTAFVSVFYIVREVAKGRQG
jgi:hypothetical protein